MKIVKIHIGEKIKGRASELRIGPTELAKLINTSKQNVYGIFKRETIDTGLLQKFSKALDYDFFNLYTIKGKAAPENNALTSQLSDLKEKYDLLRKVNELLEEKTRSKK